MPIYEYACVACGAKCEVFQGINDLPLTDCQHCGKPSLQKLISAAGFRLKGGGWYETDFKKDNDKKKNLVDAVSSSVSPVPSASSTSTETSV